MTENDGSDEDRGSITVVCEDDGEEPGEQPGGGQQLGGGQPSQPPRKGTAGGNPPGQVPDTAMDASPIVPAPLGSGPDPGPSRVPTSGCP